MRNKESREEFRKEMEKLKEEENIKKAEQVVRVETEPAFPTIEFKKELENGGSVAINQEASKRAGQLVEKAFEQAVVNQVVSNQNLQDDLMNSAEEVIKNKTSVIKSEADTEAKVAHFNNKKNACECFGYNEATTEKWAVNIMNAVHNVLTAIWIVIGTFTFAPITFVCKKIKVIVKASWAAVLLAIVVYAIVVTSPLWGSLIAKISG